MMTNKSKLIDADTLLLEIANSPGLVDAYKILSMISNAPAVDAVEVVRCNDCKHYALWGDGRFMHHCDRHDCTAYDDDYCSCGERRTLRKQQ